MIHRWHKKDFAAAVNGGLEGNADIASAMQGTNISLDVSIVSDVSGVSISAWADVGGLCLQSMAGSADHQNKDINIVNICTTTNTTNTKRHNGLKDKGIVTSSRITDPTKLNYRQHYDTFINQTMTKQCIKPYPMTKIRLVEIPERNTNRGLSEFAPFFLPFNWRKWWFSPRRNCRSEK